MKLRDYLHFNHITKTKMAEDLGISRTHLTQILKGRHTPRLGLAHKIEQITNGKVTTEDFLKEPDAKSNKE